MSEEEEKAAFAVMLLKTPNDPFKAALELHPDNTNRALWIATHWPKDPEVVRLKQKLIEDEGEQSFLPSKADLARRIWERLDSAWNAEDFAKLAKLYAEVNGFIEKPQNSTNVNVVQQRVMVIRDHGSDEEWENKARSQQRALVNGEYVAKH